jgi:hypothetical protein
LPEPQDLQVCIHECRVTAEDELYVASLAPTRDLKLLDLTHLLREVHVTEFDSLDIAVHMVFLAGPHSYEIARIIACASRDALYDGVIYPSYFSLLRTGGMPFETAYDFVTAISGGCGIRAGEDHPEPRPVRPARSRRHGHGARHQPDGSRSRRYGVRFGPVGFEREPWRPELFTEEPAEPQ